MIIRLVLRAIMHYASFVFCFDTVSGRCSKSMYFALTISSINGSSWTLEVGGNGKEPNIDERTHSKSKKIDINI